MKKYKHIGNFNGVDAVIMAYNRPSTIINNIGKKGNFESSTTDEVVTPDDLSDRYIRFTKDKQYLILYDVSDMAVFHYNGKDTNYCYDDEFIDVYKLMA